MGGRNHTKAELTIKEQSGPSKRPHTTTLVDPRNGVTLNFARGKHNAQILAYATFGFEEWDNIVNVVQQARSVQKAGVRIKKVRLTADGKLDQDPGFDRTGGETE